jgi:hypothetical protein
MIDLRSKSFPIKKQSTREIPLVQLPACAASEREPTSWKRAYVLSWKSGLAWGKLILIWNIASSGRDSRLICYFSRKSETRRRRRARLRKMQISATRVRFALRRPLINICQSQFAHYSITRQRASELARSLLCNQSKTSHLVAWKCENTYKASEQLLNALRGRRGWCV